MVDIYLNCKEDFRKEAKYVFTIFFEILGIPYSLKHSLFSPRLVGRKLTINYSSSVTEAKSFKGFLINISTFDYTSFVKLRKEPKVCFICDQERKEKIAYFFKNNLETLDKSWFQETNNRESLITYNLSQINCSVDLISSAYHLLSLQNEECIMTKDELGRFQRDFSTVSDAVYDYPVVDAYCQLLFSFLLKAGEYLSLPIVHKAFWSDEYQFALCLTHDIDRLNTWTLRKVFRYVKCFLKNKNYTNIKVFSSKLFQLLRSFIHKSNWLGNFELIIDEEKKYNFRSSFYFVAQKHDSLDPSYKLNSTCMTNRFKCLSKKEVEIGLHGSIRSADTGDYLKNEKSRLEKIINKKIYGGRQHFLRFLYPITFNNIEQAKLKYDSTLGFTTGLGYRAGISFPYKPYNRNVKKAYDFYEIPLVIMDTSMVKNKHFQVLECENFKKLFKKIENFLENAYKYQGCLTILWHNTEFDPIDVSGYTRMYRDILKWVDDKGGWGCSGHELWNWWRSRASYNFNYKMPTKNFIDINVNLIKSDAIFLNIYYPKRYKNFSIDCKNGSVISSYRDNVLKLKVKNISVDSIQLQIRPLDSKEGI